MLVVHLENSIELVEVFHLANPEKPNQANLDKAIQESAEKKAKRKARTKAAWQVKEARKHKAEKALVDKPKRCSKRLQHRVENALGGD